MGQLKSTRCPVCDGPNGGRWTCERCTPLLKTHREMIRNLQAWTSGYESQEVPEVLVAGDGNEYCLWDVKAFYDRRVDLPDRMKQAIEMCLYYNMLERKAAEAMGLSPTNPVSIYANVGIARLLSWSFQGLMGAYNPFSWSPSLEKIS